MNSLNVVTSSSLISLATSMADSFRARPLSPFARETIVTLSNGMGRWLSMELASSLGVCAAMDFRYPNDTLDACFRAVLPDIPESSPFAMNTLTWRIAAHLPGLLHLPSFAPLAGYLGTHGDDRRLLQLSRSLADTFDQYTIYRPQMILEWDAGGGSDWQAELWRSLTADYSGIHRAALLNRFREALSSDCYNHTNLPERISLFGISFLPPFHLDAFSILSRIFEVNIYLFNPCGLFWGDLFSEKRKATLALGSAVPSEALEFYETGNPLLSSLGTQGQEFFNLLMDFDASWNSLDEGTTPESTSLLGMIQKDILELNNRCKSEQKSAVSTEDRSITIHSCHGPLREMEILYDQLLSMFDEIPDLEPRSVVVMTPDLDNYAPYIRAVFGTRSGGRPAIPFTIADQSSRSVNPLINTFMSILKLPSSRFGLNSILEILESPQIKARFEITDCELETIREWVVSSGIRWGLDSDHRLSLGFPPFNEYSWQEGLDKLFLGYAMTHNNGTLYRETLPSENIEGLTALVLGKLALFIDTCRQVRSLLSSNLTLIEWADRLTMVADKFLIPINENDTSCSALYTAFQTLRKTTQESGFIQAIGIEALAEHLTSLLESSGSASGFLNGRITFCAMLPMRSIPQRVICLVGMNDGLFPRNPRQPGFNLMNGVRRRGDRSVRDEDRYLFLEAVMSSSERLYISYMGQNDRDNTSIPPSVVVSELLDYIQRGFCQTSDTSTSPAIVTRHRLQGFSPDYFRHTPNSNLFSYSSNICEALESRQRAELAGRIFIREPLVKDESLVSQLDIKDLIRFLSNPAQTFLSHRMKVYPHNPEEENDEREPFTLDNFSMYGLKQNLVLQALSGDSCNDLFPFARAKGVLPPLRAGQMAFSSLMEQTAEFSERILPHCTTVIEPYHFSYELDGLSLTGTLENIQQEVHLRWRNASMKGTDRLSLWIEHLVLNCLKPAGYPRKSLLICKDTTMALTPLDNASEILTDLVGLYREGLCRPLHFFPQSAWLCISHGYSAAKERWEGSDFGTFQAESADPANSLCHAGCNVLDEEFKELAQRVYGPIMKALAVEGEIHEKP